VSKLFLFQYFISSSREPCAVSSPQSEPSKPSSIDLITVGDLPAEASVPVVGSQDSSLPIDKHRIVLNRSISSSDFENNIDNTRRSLFNKFSNTSGTLITSPCKPDLSEQTSVVTDRLPEQKRRKNDSESEQHAQSTRIGCAMNKAAEEDLIGDFTKPFCLPRTDCKHNDLKSISSQTVRLLYSLNVECCIDACRLMGWKADVVNSANQDRKLRHLVPCTNDPCYNLNWYTSLIWEDPTEWRDRTCSYVLNFGGGG